MDTKKISEEAKWFLKHLQGIQDNFAEAIGGQIVATDSEGNLITEMSGKRRVCKIIQKTEKGKERCTNAYHKALSLVKEKEEPIFMKCHSGFASLWVPIKTPEGRIVGSITGCGGRYDEGKTRKELEKEFNKVADDIGLTEEIHSREDFLKAAIDEVKVTSREEMKKRAERLSKLVGSLAEETALKEAFTLKGEEW